MSSSPEDGPRCASIHATREEADAAARVINEAHERGEDARVATVDEVAGSAEPIDATYPHRRYVVTDYYVKGQDGRQDGARSYIGILRASDTDESVRAQAAVDHAVAVAQAHDGDEIEIIAVRTGRRPFGDRRVRLVRPHEYEREPTEGGGGGGR